MTTPTAALHPHVIELDRPAELFPHAFVLGNGRLGATVSGGTPVEHIDINVDTLWSGGPLGAQPSARIGDIDALRAAVRQKDHEAADRAARGIQSDGWTQSYQPVGRLSWRWASDATASAEYVRQLHLAHAEAVTRNGHEVLTGFVSAADGVAVFETDAAGDGTLDFTSPHPSRLLRESADGLDWIIAAGRVPADVKPNYVDLEPAVVYDDAAPDADGTVARGMGWALAAAASVNSATGARRVIFAAVSGYRGFDERPSADLDALADQARALVLQASALATADLRSRHREAHAALFDRVAIDLSASGPEAVQAQRYFDFGRYLLISSSRAGTQPANLQGIWNVDVRPPWSGNYTTNINVQMNYWGAEVAALGDLHESYLDLTAELAEAGATTAQIYYGADGTAAHHNTDLWRFSAPVHGDPQWANWPSALPWMAAHIGEVLDFRGDYAIDRDRALRTLRPIVRFMLWHLEGDDELSANPSTSPEHRFRESGVVGAVTAGAALDQELAIEMLERYLALATGEGEDLNLARRVREALPRVREPFVDAEGRLLEWGPSFESTELGHRHLSHLYGVFPGARITASRRPELLEAARKALEFRLSNGSGYTGWSQAWVLCLAARLGDPALASSSLHTLVHELSSPSLLDLHPHPDWPGEIVFQIDGNLGAIAGIAELLVQSHDDAVSLLPTLPVEWTAGSARGLRARGGHRVDLEWSNGSLRTARVSSGVGGELTLEVADGSWQIVDGQGVPVPTDAAPGPVPGRTRLGWRTAPGEVYTVSG